MYTRYNIIQEETRNAMSLNLIIWSKTVLYAKIKLLYMQNYYYQ